MTNLAQIEYFKKEAKKLLWQVQAGDADALARMQRVLKGPEDISLMRVQHVIAVECSFSKWEELIKAPAVELQAAIAKKKVSSPRSNELPKRAGTPLGNFLRGPGIIPTSPHLAAAADFFDTMTLRGQERYLDEDARRVGLFDRR